MKHSLRRTSPKGQDFIGTCTLCGTPDLPMNAVTEDCPNQRGLTQEEVVIEAILPPGTNSDPDMPSDGWNAPDDATKAGTT